MGLGGGVQAGAQALSAAIGGSSNVGNNSEVDQLSASLLGMAMSPRRIFVKDATTLFPDGVDGGLNLQGQTTNTSAAQTHAQHTQAHHQGSAPGRTDVSKRQAPRIAYFLFLTNPEITSGNLTM
eukprot:2992178-Pyramimonas_sp.AAC.1